VLCSRSRRFAKLFTIRAFATLFTIQMDIVNIGRRS